MRIKEIFYIDADNVSKDEIVNKINEIIRVINSMDTTKMKERDFKNDK